MRATGVGNLGKKKIRYTPDMILTFLLAHANYRKWSDKSKFIFERHPELEGELNYKNFKELSIRHGWFKSAQKMKNDALRIAVEDAKEEKANLTQSALHNELDMVSDLEEERAGLISSLKTLDKGSKAYASALSSLDKVTKMIASITDTDRLRRRDALADSAEAALYIAEKKGELKNVEDPLAVAEKSTVITEDDDSFTV